MVAPADGRVSLVVNAVPPAELGLGDAAAAAHLDLHERVRLPREPQPGVRPDRADRLSQGPVPQRRPRQGERGQRAQLPSSSPAGAPRIGVVQIAGLIARRIVPFVQRGPDRRGRRPHRHDPVRLAGRRLSAGGRRAAGGGGPDRASPARPCIADLRRQNPGRTYQGRLMVNAPGTAPWRCGGESRYIGGMIFSPFDRDRMEARRQRFRAIPVRIAAAQPDHAAGAVRRPHRASGSRSRASSKWALAAIVFAAALDGIDGRLARHDQGPVASSAPSSTASPTS